MPCSAGSSFSVPLARPVPDLHDIAKTDTNWLLLKVRKILDTTWTTHYPKERVP